jgi:enamine deaminase RidA (YjgF/YER057c/UK114 family)
MGNVELKMPGRGYSNVAVVSGNVKTVYVGGQNAVDEAGNIVGKGDFVKQVEQIYKNLETALAAGGAKLEHVIKWNIYVVPGQDLEAAFGAFQKAWGNRPATYPLITVAFVAGLGHPDWLAELEAIAVVPE